MRAGDGLFSNIVEFIYLFILKIFIYLIFSDYFDIKNIFLKNKK